MNQVSCHSISNGAFRFPAPAPRLWNQDTEIGVAGGRALILSRSLRIRAFIRCILYPVSCIQSPHTSDMKSIITADTARRLELATPGRRPTYADTPEARHAVADHFRQHGEKTASAWSTEFRLRDNSGRVWAMTEWSGRNWPEFNTLDTDRSRITKSGAEAYEEFFQI